MPTSPPEPPQSQPTVRSARDRVDDVIATVATLGLDVKLSVSGNLQHVPARLVDQMIVALDAGLSTILRSPDRATVEVVVASDGDSIDLQVGNHATRSVDEVVDWHAQF